MIRIKFLFLYLYYFSINKRNNYLSINKFKFHTIKKFQDILLGLLSFNLPYINRKFRFNFYNYRFFSALGNFSKYKKDMLNIKQIHHYFSIDRNLSLNLNVYYTSFFGFYRNKTQYLNRFFISNCLFDLVSLYKSKLNNFNNTQNLFSRSKISFYKRILNYGRYYYPLLAEGLNGYYMKKIGVFFYRNNGARRLFRRRLDMSYRNKPREIFPVFFFEKTFDAAQKVFFKSFILLYNKLKFASFPSTLDFIEFNIDNFYYKFILFMINFVLISHYPVSCIFNINNDVNITSKRAFFLLSKLRRRANNFCHIKTLFNIIS